MISILSMIINTLLKTIISMLSWFIKFFIKAVKFFISLLPVTGIIFLAFFALNLFMMFMGTPANVDTIFSSPERQSVLTQDKAILSSFVHELLMWWKLNIYSYKGEATYILLLILTVLMIVPVFTIILCITVFTGFYQYLFIAVLADIFIYSIRTIFGKSPVTQFLDRYYFLFPARGKKHYEKDYEKWLRKHHRDFEEDDDEKEYTSRKRKHEDFYESEDDDDFDDYDNNYNHKYEYDRDRYDDYEDEYYGDDDSDEEDYDNNYEDEDYSDDDYDDEYYDEHNEHKDQKESVVYSSFDFFAGCNSRESVEKKYHSLAKLYHPDNIDGDTKALQEINRQYEIAKSRF